VTEITAQNGETGYHEPSAEEPFFDTSLPPFLVRAAIRGRDTVDRHSPANYDILANDQQIKHWLGSNAVLSTILVAGFAIMTVMGSSGISIKTSKATTTETATAEPSDGSKLRQQIVPHNIQPISLDR